MASVAKYGAASPKIQAKRTNVQSLPQVADPKPIVPISQAIVQMLESAAKPNAFALRQTGSVKTTVTANAIVTCKNS